MPFDWRGYFSLAQELSQRQNEAALRSAISRAYYAAFCSARVYLEKQGVTISTMGQDSHTLVWKEFQGKGKNAAAIFQNGNRLKNRRKQADYDHTVDKLSDTVIAAMHEAETIFHWLMKLHT
ncbi:MAG: HEPN domain-containing protein [Blastocatellia bacterium]